MNDDVIIPNIKHYDKEEISGVMKPEFKKIGIIREAENQFISSFSFYHFGFDRFTKLFNPDAEYHQTAHLDIPIHEKKAPTTADLELEMEKFLEAPYQILDQINSIQKLIGTSWIYMATLRPQLLYYGQR